MNQKLILSIIVSIILTVLAVSIINIGLSIFLERPEWDDYCGTVRVTPFDKTDPEEIVCAQDVKECPDGTTVSRDPRLGCEFPPCSDEFSTCQEEYQAANDRYNQVRFYVLALIGFILLIFGLYSSEYMIKWPSLASGGILIVEGVVLNLENKVLVFIALVIIILVFGYIARKMINKIN